MGAFFSWLLGKTRDELLKTKESRLKRIAKLQKEVEEIETELNKEKDE